MKKIVLAIGLFSFVAFGIVGIQSMTAATASIEYMKCDKDPKKEGEKKADTTKETKAEAKSDAGCNDMKASSGCGDKSASSCCGHEAVKKESPDKK